MDELTLLWLMTPEAPDVGELLAQLRRPEWHHQAACRGMETDAFFPGRGESSDEARAICEGCAVRKDCLSAALAAGDSCWGVWGGLSNRGRRVLRRGVGLGRHFLVPQRWGNG